MRSPRKCQAADPDTCRHHNPQGFAALKSSQASAQADKQLHAQPLEPALPDAGDLFEQAMRRNPRFAAMEAAIAYKKNKIRDLQGRYDFMKPPVTDIFDPIPYGASLLTEHNDNYEEFNKKLSDDELEAIKEYTGIGYIPVNELLRDEKKYNERLKEYIERSNNPEGEERQRKYAHDIIKNLDSAISKAGIADEPYLVYRVLGQDLTKPFTGSEVFAEDSKFTTGSEVVFKNFGSSTFDASFVNRYVGKDEEHTSVVLVIKTRQGAPVSRTAVNAKDITYTQDSEREILLPRDTRYKVTKVTRTRFNTQDNHLEPIEPLTVFMEEVLDSDVKVNKLS